MLFSYGYGQQQLGKKKKIRQIAGDFDCHTDAALTNRAHPGLHSDPLDAAIGQVPVPYRPGGQHGRRIC